MQVGAELEVVAALDPVQIRVPLVYAVIPELFASEAGVVVDGRIHQDRAQRSGSKGDVSGSGVRSWDGELRGRLQRAKRILRVAVADAAKAELTCEIGPESAADSDVVHVLAYRKRGDGGRVSVYDGKLPGIPLKLPVVALRDIDAP